jgi:cysteine-rich repeat protein
LIEALEGAQSTTEKIAINVSLERDDLAAPGRARRVAVRARQKRVLDSFPRGTFDLTYRYQSLSGFSGRIPVSAIEGLRRHPEVVAIHLDYELQASLAEGNALIGADSVHAAGLTGAGVVVAVLDTGIDTNHPDLLDDLVAEQCFCNDHPAANRGCCPNRRSEQSGAGAAEDDEGHGTHTAGIITSGGVVSAKGVAPDAGIVAIKVLAANGRGSSSNTAAGLDWIVSNHATFGIDLVNASLGDGLEHNNPLASPCSGTLTANAVSLLHAAGIAFFAASGNEGYDDGISEPACIADAISVGGVYDSVLGTVGWCGNASCTTTLCSDVSGPDVFVCHSNSDEILDVLAPNWRTTSPSMGGGASGFGGTSAASPYAAGQAALLLEADSALQPEDLRTLLESHGPSVTNPDNGLSFPRSDVSAAIAVLATCGDGVLEFGESCDDGNVLDGDCCSSICEYDPVGAACDDGDPCTAESCDVLAGCVHAPIPECPAAIPSGSAGSRGILLALILGSVACLSSAGFRLSRTRSSR